MITVGTGNFYIIIILVYAIIDNVVMLFQIASIIIKIPYIYIALFWRLNTLYIEGGDLLNHHQCAAPTWMRRRIRRP